MNNTTYYVANVTARTADLLGPESFDMKEAAEAYADSLNHMGHPDYAVIEVAPVAWAPVPAEPSYIDA